MQSLFHYILMKLVSNEDVTKGYLLGEKNSASMVDDQPLGAQGLGVGSDVGVHAGQSKAGGQGNHCPEAGAGQSRGLPCPDVGRRCGLARPARTIQFGGPGHCGGSGVRICCLLNFNQYLDASIHWAKVSGPVWCGTPPTVLVDDKARM